MVYGLWLSAAGLQANQLRQDIIANNLANVETTGFKRDLALFSERMIAAREPLGDSNASADLMNSMTGGTFVAPTYTVFEQGTVMPTDRPFDVALVGEGFFTIRDADRTLYTRDGRFAVNAQSELVTSDGKAVLSDAGTTIRIPPDQLANVRITPDGRVRTGNVDLARLGIVDFEDKQQLKKVGSNRFAAPDGVLSRPANATVEPRALEASGVDPATTMIAMIEASRAYQLNASMISMQDAMLGRAATDIARIR
jgi:flagellar basal-body rod protein FlgG